MIWWKFFFLLMYEILIESYIKFVSYFVCYNFINIFVIKIYVLLIVSYFLEICYVVIFYWIVFDIFLNNRLVCFFLKNYFFIYLKVLKKWYVRIIYIWCICGCFIGIVLWLIVFECFYFCFKLLILKFLDLRFWDLKYFLSM